MLPRIFSFKNVFALLVTLWFAYCAWESRNYAFLAKVFPFYISIALAALGVINLVQEVAASIRRTDSSGSSFADLSAKWSIPSEAVWRRFFVYIGMILVLYACIWVIGYPLTLTIFIFLFYRLLARASWWTSLIAGLAGLGFLALMSHVLGMDWPEGLIHLPWPLG